MLMDRVRELESDIRSQIRPDDGYVAIHQMNARDVLEIAQSLIAVEKVVDAAFARSDTVISLSDIYAALESTKYGK